MTIRAWRRLRNPRDVPALLLYRGVLDARERTALALMSSIQLPLVLAITTLATDTGHVRAPG